MEDVRWKMLDGRCDSFSFVDFAHARDSEQVPSPLAYPQSSRLPGHLGIKMSQGHY